MENTKQIVIVGAGAGGLPLATKLGQHYKRDDSVQVILIDKSMVHVWKPMLHEVAAGTLTSNEDEINLFSHGEQHGYQFCFGSLDSIDKVEQTLKLAAHTNNTGEAVLPGRTVCYDLLVLAVGATCDDFDTEGVAEYAIFLDDRASAEHCHQQFVHTLLSQQQPNKYSKTAADNHTGEANNSKPVVIVGAGATGVELAAQLQWFIDSQRHLAQNESGQPTLKIILLEAADQCLPALEAGLASEIAASLKSMSIDLRLETAVEKIEKNRIITANEEIEAGLVIWAAGIKALDWQTELGLETDEKNRIKTNKQLQSITDKRILALGDCAAVPFADNVVPALAQAAFQQANYLAKQIPRMLASTAVTEPFEFVDRGTLITLAGKDAAGNLRSRFINRLRLHGAAAKIAYRTLYRRHQLSIIGPWQTCVAILKSWLSKTAGPQATGPRIKLH